MGLFDTVKLKANALAADAERAGKVTAAQARTVVLQNDIRKAERELGHSAFSLIESGAIAHPDLEAAALRLREAWQVLKTKEAEIAGLRHGAAAGNDAAPVPADEAAGPAAADPIVEAPPAGDPIAEASPAAKTAVPVKAAAGAAKKPAAKRPAPAAKKPAADKPAPAVKKPAAKKAPAKKPPAGKPAAKKAPAKKPPAAGA
jgi:hypothetical protein